MPTLLFIHPYRSYQISKWELGTQNFEALAGVTAAIDYIASVGARFGHGAAAEPGSSQRRAEIVAAWEAIRAHETRIKTRFLEGRLPTFHRPGY